MEIHLLRLLLFEPYLFLPGLKPNFGLAESNIQIYANQKKP